MATILVIEDEDIIRAQVEQILQTAGYEVRCAPNGAVGLKAALEAPPDLVLCDMMMPVLDGNAVLKAIRDHPPTAHVPFVFLTAKDSNADLRNAMNLGADDYLSKPFRVRELLDAVAARLKRNRATQQAIRHSHSAVHNAGTDPATGLPNRLSLREMLEEARAMAPGSFLGVTVVGLPRFYDAVEATGVAEEDLQRANAAWLQERVPSGRVAVLQPDRWLVLTGPHEAAQDAEAAAQALFPSAVMEVLVCGHKIIQPCAVGVAVTPPDGQRVDELVRRATRALTEGGSAPGIRRVSSGHGSGSFHDPVALEGAMRAALRDRQFSLHFQPQFDIKTGALAGAEALVRWLRPNAAPISPAQFIPVAEESGFILELGQWVMDSAMTQLQKWMAQGLTPAHMSVNVSALQLNDSGFVQMVETATRRHKLPVGQLVLELTETVAARDLDRAANALQAARDLGAHVSLDDFGTGYSSLGYLSRLPLNHLKLDRSLVQDLHQHTNKRTIVSGVVDMAHHMDLVVVAEGVELQDELDVLKTLNCDRVQGYHTGRPMPADDFAHLCRSLAS